MAKTQKISPENVRNQPVPEQNQSCVPPWKIDEILLEAFDALEQTRRLHESTANPDTKRQTKRILSTLQSTLNQLAPLGVHSLSRLERLPSAV